MSATRMASEHDLKIIDTEDKYNHEVRMVAHYEREIAHLKAAYGTGVRPAWVSTDIGIAEGYRNQHQANAQELYRKLKDLQEESTDDRPA